MSIITEVPDQTLLEKCLACDEHAREQFFIQCKMWFIDFIQNDLFHKGTPRDWLDEVTALALETLVAADYRRLRAFRPGRGPLAGYLAAIARDQFNLFLRKRYRQKQHERSLDRCPKKKMQTQDDHLESEIEEISCILTPKEKWHYIKCNLEIPSKEVLASDSSANRRKLDQRIRDKLRTYQAGPDAKPVHLKGAKPGCSTQHGLCKKGGAATSKGHTKTRNRGRQGPKK